MQATALSIALRGLEPHLVRVEVDSGRGLPTFHLVGLPEASVRESRVRVRAALAQLGIELNEHVITINMAPAYLKKSGSSFDVAIAVATLGALGRVPVERLGGLVLLGELSLSGEIRAARGVLPSLLGAARLGLREAIVPRENGAEAAAVSQVEARTAATLAELVEHLNGASELPRAQAKPGAGVRPLFDLADVRGQGGARRALEVAAAGGHHLLMMGPPGAGKTMLAQRLPTILPPLGDEEAIELTAVHSIAGLLRHDDGLLRTRPFRAPHHTASAAALLGGGAPLRPGEISLAHGGCLFLDELLEFRRHVLEGMRQPLEDGVVSICRAQSRATFPARPLLVAALNPCPCGYSGDPRRVCSCGAERARAYRSRLSGPLVDRIDLHLVLPPVSLAELQSGTAGESSAEVRARVMAVRALQLDRFARGEVKQPLNSRLGQSDLDRVARPDAAGRALLEMMVEDVGLSARGYLKVLRMGRTIADLAGSDAVRRAHLDEAVAARSLEPRTIELNGGIHRRPKWTSESRLSSEI